MAHQHLHFKEELDSEQTREKQLRVSVALLGTLAGGVLLINSGSPSWAPSCWGRPSSSTPSTA
jgi:hypothetical protein